MGYVSILYVIFYLNKEKTLPFCTEKQNITEICSLTGAWSVAVVVEFLLYVAVP